MVATLKRSIRKTIFGAAPAFLRWDDALRNALYGYRRRKMVVGLSLFELLYGVLPRMASREHVPLLGVSEVRHREIELLHVRAMRPTRIIGR